MLCSSECTSLVFTKSLLARGRGPRVRAPGMARSGTGVGDQSCPFLPRLHVQGGGWGVVVTVTQAQPQSLALYWDELLELGAVTARAGPSRPLPRHSLSHIRPSGHLHGGKGQQLVAVQGIHRRHSHNIADAGGGLGRRRHALGLTAWGCPTKTLNADQLAA